VEIAAPALVPLVEAGLAASVQARDAVRAMCRALPADVDAIVYGCTHYPLLDPHFAAVLDARVARIDPAIAQAEAAADIVRRLSLAPGDGVTQYLTSGDLGAFEANVRSWTGERGGLFSSTKALAS
jgi:glutamate racemase